jgi:hypothetical protein
LCRHVVFQLLAGGMEKYRCLWQSKWHAT